MKESIEETGKELSRNFEVNWIKFIEVELRMECEEPRKYLKEETGKNNLGKKLGMGILAIREPRKDFFWPGF